MCVCVRLCVLCGGVSASVCMCVYVCVFCVSVSMCVLCVCVSVCVLCVCVCECVTINNVTVDFIFLFVKLFVRCIRHCLILTCI